MCARRVLVAHRVRADLLSRSFALARARQVAHRAGSVGVQKATCQQGQTDRTAGGAACPGPRCVAHAPQSLLSLRAHRTPVAVRHQWAVARSTRALPSNCAHARRTGARDVLKWLRARDCVQAADDAEERRGGPQARRSHLAWRMGHAHSQCLARPPAHRVRRPGRQRRALHAASDAAEQPRGGPQARRSHLPTAPTSPPHPPSHRSHLAVALTWLRPPPGCGSCLAIAPTWPQLSPSHSPHLATALTWPRLPPGHGSHLPPSPPSPPPPSPPSLPPPRPRRRSRRRRREWAQWQQRRPRRAWPAAAPHSSRAPSSAVSAATSPWPLGAAARAAAPHLEPGAWLNARGSRLAVRD